MTFSTRSNPRIAASPVALTSLGAVGGARGTAAGALRIFVEFLTQYDRKEVETLENDLRQIDHAQNNSVIAEEKRQRRLTSVRNSLAEAERVVRGKLNTQLRSDLKTIEELESSRSKSNKVAAAAQREQFNALARSLGLSKNEITLLESRGKLRREEARLVARSASADRGQLERTRQRAAVEQQLFKTQQGRANLAPRLAGLAVGAIGGIVGGAVLGVGFAAAEAAIERIGTALQDILDPARHARDAIKELGAEVLELAQNQDLTLFEAATIKARELGVETDKTAVSLLEEFAATTKAAQAAKDYAQFVTAAAHGTSVREEAIEQLRLALVEQAKAENDAAIAAAQARGENVANTQTLANLPLVIRNVNGEIRQFINGEDSATVATRVFDQLLGTNTDTINENAFATRKLAAERQALADASALASVAQDQLTSALEAAADAQISAIDARINKLGDVGPSARTKALEAAIDAAQSGGGGDTAARNAELRNIQQERELILLRQRLRLMGANIDLDKFSGRFLLEAINAKIAAINKQAAAEDRLNRLLDLRYRMSQRITRQQGESINDFIERRAQEQRGFLVEQRDIERENLIAGLEERRDKVEDEIALAELSKRKQEALRRDETRDHIKNLQKQLEASRKADRDALEAKRRALEAEKEAIRRKVKEAVRLASQQSIQETLAAIRGMKDMDDVIIVRGRIAGLTRARGVIEGLVKGFGIPPAIAKEFLANIDKALTAYNLKGAQLEQRTRRRSGALEFASGGILDLKNSRTPFGQNVKTGEEGSEIAVILSNKVTQALKTSTGGPQAVGPFYIQSSDPMRERYALRRAVREGISEALS